MMQGNHVKMNNLVTDYSYEIIIYKVFYEINDLPYGGKIVVIQDGDCLSNTAKG